jgi:hypothetical protein
MIRIPLFIENAQSSVPSVSPFSYLTSSAPDKSNLQFSKSLANAFNEPILQRLLTVQVTNLISIFTLIYRSTGLPQSLKEKLPMSGLFNKKFSNCQVTMRQMIEQFMDNELGYDNKRFYAS